MKHLFTIRLQLLLLSLCGVVLPAALSAQACSFGGEEAFDSLVKDLRSAPSCSVAFRRLSDCAWGSSADTQFSPIVVEKCEAAFLEKLPKPAIDRYMEEMQLCAYQNEFDSGTMALSAAALCQAKTAEHFADKPTAAKETPLNASFDCKKSSTPLEKAICSDAGLGHADIILSRNFADYLLNSSEAAKQFIRSSEARWLQDLPTTCALTQKPGKPAIDCLRHRFEMRFTALGDCLDGEPATNCVETSYSEALAADKVENISPARASFDCEQPKTGLEIVICTNAELGKTDIKLAETYRTVIKKIPAPSRQELISSERNWLGRVSQTCPLGAVGGIPSVIGRACVQKLFENRIAQLQSCSKVNSEKQIECFSEFRSIGTK